MARVEEGMRVLFGEWVVEDIPRRHTRLLLHGCRIDQKMRLTTVKV